MSSTRRRPAGTGASPSGRARLAMIAGGVLAAAAVLLALAGSAEAARPTLSGTEVVLDAGQALAGRIKFHYTLSGADAPTDLRDEQPANGVPDLIDDYETGIARAWTAFVIEDGWTPPLPDEGRGGDDALDVYVRQIGLFGMAHYEPLTGSDAHATWIELNCANASLGHAGASSVAAHEFHHALQAALSTSLAPWIDEATASWAQYLLFEGDPMVDLGRDVLWVTRLGGAARDFENREGRFDYAGMIWLKFLLDHGHAPRAAVLDLWRAMAEEGDWVAGHERVLPSFGLGSLDDTVARFAEWNLFACRRDDGHHYDPAHLRCDVTGDVPVARIGALPAGGDTIPIGPRGAAYLEFAGDGATRDLRVRLRGDGPFAVRAVRVAASGGSGSEAATSTTGDEIEASIPRWNEADRAVVAVVNLGASEGSFHFEAQGEGSWSPAPPASAGGCTVAPHASGASTPAPPAPPAPIVLMFAVAAAGFAATRRKR